MTKAQIKAELRRSAMCDDDPWSDVAREAFRKASAYEDPWRPMHYMSIRYIRMFYLFVAEAL